MTLLKSLDQRIVDLIASRGPMQNVAICAAMHADTFRAVDRALQRMKRDGRLVILPRKSGERPFALWALRGVKL